MARVDKVPSGGGEDELFDIAAAERAAREILKPELLSPETGPKFWAGIYTLFATRPESRFAKYGEERVAALITKARGGEHEAHLALCEIARYIRRERHLPIAALDDYVIAAAENGPPPSRPGSSPHKFSSRNFCIMMAVSRVMEFGFNKTRTRTARYKQGAGDSACSIVGRVMGMDEEAVKAAYDAFRHLDV